MTPNKNFFFKVLCLWALTALLPAVNSTEVVVRAPCTPTSTAIIVIEVVYTASGVSALPTTTVTTTYTSTAGVPFSTPGVPGFGSDPGSNNGGATTDTCGTTTQYSIAVITVGPQNTQTVTQSVTITVPPASSSSQLSSSVGNSGVSSPGATNASAPSSAVTSSSMTSNPQATSAITSSATISSSGTSQGGISSGGTGGTRSALASSSGAGSTGAGSSGASSSGASSSAAGSTGVGSSGASSSAAGSPGASSSGASSSLASSSVAGSPVASSSGASSSGASSSAAGSPVASSSAAGSSGASSSGASSSGASSSGASSSGASSSGASSSGASSSGASSGATSFTSSTSYSSATTASTSPTSTRYSPLPSPTFWLQASNVSSVSGGDTNANLARSNDQYARLFLSTPADSQGSQNLDFALASRSLANVFTIDSQNRLVELYSGLVATTQNGTAQKVFFDPVGNYISSFYAPITCSAQASTGSSVYSTLQCVGSTSTTGAQTITAVCYGSSVIGVGANGKLFLASTLTTVPSDCRSVVLNMVPYVASM